MTTLFEEYVERITVEASCDACGWTTIVHRDAIEAGRFCGNGCGFVTWTPSGEAP